MQALFRPPGPLTPPLVTEIGVRPGPNLVPVVQCGVNGQGRRIVSVWVRNDGSEPTRRLFTAIFTISVGRQYISGQVPIRSLRPGQSVLLESTDANFLQGIQPIITFVDVDPARLIPENINPANNRTVTRCSPSPIVGTM